MEIMLNYNRFLRFNNWQIGIPRRFSIQPDLPAASSSLAYWEKKMLQRPDVCLMESLKSRVSSYSSQQPPAIVRPSGTVFGASLTGGPGSIPVTMGLVLPWSWSRRLGWPGLNSLEIGALKLRGIVLFQHALWIGFTVLLQHSPTSPFRDHPEGLCGPLPGFLHTFV